MVASGADQLSAGKVQFHDPEVEVDVMPSTEGDELPLAEEERVFAFVRRWTMRTASRVSLGVVDETGQIVATTDLLVASRAALITLKAVSIPRRRQGSYPENIGSDIQDLFRLVDGQDLETLAGDFDSLDEEARTNGLAPCSRRTSPATVISGTTSRACGDTRAIWTRNRSPRTTWPSFPSWARHSLLQPSRAGRRHTGRRTPQLVRSKPLVRT